MDGTNNRGLVLRASSGNQPESEIYITHRKRKLTGIELARFNGFWRAFNWKKGKAAAADAWLDIDHMNDALFNTILQAAHWEAAARARLQQRGQSPKWGQGWLNEKRWEDEYNIEDTNNLDYSNSAVARVRRANNLDCEKQNNRRRTVSPQATTTESVGPRDITASAERIQDSEFLDKDGCDLRTPLDQ